MTILLFAAAFKRTAFTTIILLYLVVADIAIRLTKRNDPSSLFKMLKFLAKLLVRGIFPLFNINVLINQRFNGSNDKIIIVSNHQSFADIPILIFAFSKKNLKFIAKKELMYYIPAFSVALRGGAGTFIDRSDREQAIAAIKETATTCDQDTAMVIFPEGTRSKKGGLRRFKKAGLITLMRSLTNAKIQPVAISNSYKINNLPLGSITVYVDVLPSLDINAFADCPNKLIHELETSIGYRIKHSEESQNQGT